MTFFILAKACILAAILLTSAGFSLDGAELTRQGDLSEIVKSEGVSPEHSALIIVRLEDGVEWMSGGFRTEKTFSPASTSKIPHTLIALEEKYIDGPDAHFEWDGQERFLEAWNQGQTLSSAFKYSVVWVYQQITRDLGHETMSRWIDQFKYGNHNIGTPENITTYWLNGPLETSARDQIQFLSALACEKLQLTVDTFRVGKQIMREAAGENWVLYAKASFDGKIGWYAGWVEIMVDARKKTYVFAFNMDIANWNELPSRKTVVLSALNDLAVIFRSP